MLVEKQIKTYEYYYYEDLVKAAGKLLNRSIRDFYGANQHFKKWAKKHDKLKLDPEGKHYNSSQIYYKEYLAASDGDCTCPPYCDFWLWFLNGNLGGECNNPSFHSVNFQQLRNDWFNSKSCDGEEDYVIQVLDTFIKILGDDGNKEIQILIEW
jgi:hypothetical protein